MTLGIILYAIIAVVATVFGMFAVGVCATVVAAILFVIDYKRTAYDKKYVNNIQVRL